MPCFTIIRNQVDLVLVNKELLKMAIEAIADRIISINADQSRIVFVKGGYSFTLANGKLECQQGQEGMADQIRQAYSGIAVVKATQRVGGWTIKPLQKNKFQLTRRY